MNITQNVNLEQAVGIVHEHDEVLVSMTLDSDRDEQIGRIGPTRFTFTNGAAYVCPQCGMRVNLKIESTIDTSTSAPGTHVYYASGDTTVSGG